MLGTSHLPSGREGTAKTEKKKKKKEDKWGQFTVNWQVYLYMITSVLMANLLVPLDILNVRGHKVFTSLIS